MNRTKMKYQTKPEFEELAKRIVKSLQILPKKDLKKRLKLSDNLLEHTYLQLHTHSFKYDLMPAFFMYDGLQYKRMDRENMDLEVLQNNVRILDALYGVLRPLDGISFYRLDFSIKGFDLYSFWQESVVEYFKDEKKLINLASNEYAKLLEPIKNKMTTVKFMQMRDGQRVSLGTENKIARGVLLSYLLKNGQDALEAFDEDGYHYDSANSTKEDVIFIKEE